MKPVIYNDSRKERTKCHPCDNGTPNIYVYDSCTMQQLTLTYASRFCDSLCVCVCVCLVCKFMPMHTLHPHVYVSCLPLSLLLNCQEKGTFRPSISQRKKILITFGIFLSVRKIIYVIDEKKDKNLLLVLFLRIVPIKM